MVSVQKLNKLLPDAKVVTITQIVDTQIKTNRMMAQLSCSSLGSSSSSGGASMANYMYANVYERQREIGTLNGLVRIADLLKMSCDGAAAWPGCGTEPAMHWAQWMAVDSGTKNRRSRSLCRCLLLLLAVGVAGRDPPLVASYLPARRAARWTHAPALRET